MSKTEMTSETTKGGYMNFYEVPEPIQAIMAETLKEALLTGSTKEPEEVALIIKRAFEKLMS